MSPSPGEDNRQIKKEIRFTQRATTVRLKREQKEKIDGLVEGWNFETRERLKGTLKLYWENEWGPLAATPQLVKDDYPKERLIYGEHKKREISLLADPSRLANQKERFQLTGEIDGTKAWQKIFKKELTKAETRYLLAVLQEQTTDIYVPPEFGELVSNTFNTHMRGEKVEGWAPKAPMILITGSSGSGKSATAAAAVEQYIFGANVQIDDDIISEEIEKAMEQHPFLGPLLPHVYAPEAQDKLDARNRKDWLRNNLGKPGVGKMARAELGWEVAAQLPVDYGFLSSADVKTMWYGEEGHKLEDAFNTGGYMGIRILEEAQSVLSDPGNNGASKDQQHQDLVDTAKRILDEIMEGSRPTFLIATTDQPQEISRQVYRRMNEKGKVVDVSEYWRNPENLKGALKIELRRLDTSVTSEDLDKVTEEMYRVFRERNLDMTPAYARKLISSVHKMKGDIRAEHFRDLLTVRTAFKEVARNLYGELYDRTVNKLDRSHPFIEYKGPIKDDFSGMASNTLVYFLPGEKGAVLYGPPGSGKTFLAMTYLSGHDEITDISVNKSVLADEGSSVGVDPSQVMVRNTKKVFDMARMLAPCMIFEDEADAIVPTRGAGYGFGDAIVNEHLKQIDGERPLVGVFVVQTTNRLELIDQAMYRPGRLKPLEIGGHLSQKDGEAVISQNLGDMPRDEGLIDSVIYEYARCVCQVPGDFASFAVSARNRRASEMEMMRRFKTERMDEAGRRHFLEENRAGIERVIDGYDLKATEDEYLSALEGLELDDFSDENYTLKRTHLDAARKEILSSPSKKGITAMTGFLATQLSREPQVGFVVGAAAADQLNVGFLVPIATTLSYDRTADKFSVTSTIDPESKKADQMTMDSAKEAYSLAINYLQTLVPDENISRVFGEFLEGYSFHHQFLNPQYYGGGPSAGFAMAINTLSTMLNLPVHNDFGITGAPWSRGVTKKDVGSSVIIGGADKKTQAVLDQCSMRLMYVPTLSYYQVPGQAIEDYHLHDKDVVGVDDFTQIVPEIYAFGPQANEAREELIRARITSQMGGTPEGNAAAARARLAEMAENEIRRRVGKIAAYAKGEDRDEYAPLDKILS